jgi:hypothetical protein
MMTILFMGLGVLLPVSTFAHYFKLQALPLDYFPWLAGILLGYAFRPSRPLKRFLPGAMDGSKGIVHRG